MSWNLPWSNDEPDVSLPKPRTVSLTNEGNWPETYETWRKRLGRTRLPAHKIVPVAKSHNNLLDDIEPPIDIRRDVHRIESSDFYKRLKQCNLYSNLLCDIDLVVLYYNDIYKEHPPISSDALECALRRGKFYFKKQHGKIEIGLNADSLWVLERFKVINLHYITSQFVYPGYKIVYACP